MGRRGDAGQVILLRVISWRKFWNVQKLYLQDFTTCHVEIVKCTWLSDVGCHAFREQVVTYAWQMSRHGANYASLCRWQTSCHTNGTTWHAILRSISRTKFVPVCGLLNTLSSTTRGRLLFSTASRFTMWAMLEFQKSLRGSALLTYIDGTPHPSVKNWVQWAQFCPPPLKAHL